MEKTPQRALKCLITQTDIDTHLYTHLHTRSTHATPTRAHGNTIRTHQNNTLANGKQTIHLPTHQPQQNFSLIPRPKPIPSTKAYTIQPKPVYHTAFPQRIGQLLSYPIRRGTQTRTAPVMYRHAAQEQNQQKQSKHNQ